MSNDLQPCPFCGGTARFNETEDGGHFIECTKCRSSTCLRYSLMDDAKPLLAESWNRRAQLAAAAPAAVPQTALQKEIARDAEAFEATLTLKPAREPSQVYPWGWCYVSNEVQNQFKDWCCRHPK